MGKNPVKKRTEKTIQSEIFLKLGKRPDVLLFRNNVGVAWQGRAKRASKPMTVVLHPGDVLIRQPQRVVYGLHKGSADLIGLKKVRITPDMVGQVIARFTSIEVKTKSGRPSEAQQNWERVLKQSGALAGVARSDDEAMEIIDGTDKPCGKARDTDKT